MPWQSSLRPRAADISGHPCDRPGDRDVRIATRSLNTRLERTAEKRGRSTAGRYAAGRKATIDVTHLIWQRASIKSFLLFAQPQAAWADAWNVIVPLLQSGAIKPIVAKTFPLAEAADALRYLVEGRPFGRVVLVP